MKEYKEVPNILTGKDLDYLTDLFNWNFNAYKVSINAYEHTKDADLRKVMEKSLWNMPMMPNSSVSLQ